MSQLETTDSKSAPASKAPWASPQVKRLRTHLAENDVTAATDDGVNPS